MKVLITVDTEVWCGAWDNLDARFPRQFAQYVYGHSRQGDYGLPAMLRILSDHGLTATFFVEPLFSLRFGLDRLREIVSLVQGAKQDVQMHMHTEWVNEVTHPSVPRIGEKLQHLRYFSLEQQKQLLSTGLDLLAQAGATGVNAFRAGNYGLDANTLRALAVVGVRWDTSYNISADIGVADVAPGERLLQPAVLHGVTEVPVTVFHDGIEMRPFLLTANSFGEMRRVLLGALEAGWSSVVLVTHNFELMTRSLARPDWMAVRRFTQLCDFLARHRDTFDTTGFSGLELAPVAKQPDVLRSSRLSTAARYVEQGLRRAIYAT